MILILCFLSLFAQSLAQVNGTGSCPLIKPRNFQPSKLLGHWFEYARIPNAFEPGHVCTDCSFYLNEDNVAVMHVDGTIRLSGAWYIWEGHLLPTDIEGIYGMKYARYASLDVLRTTFVDADWDHWVIMHLCSEQSGNNQQVVWIWTKDREISRRDQSRIERALRRINMSWALFEIVDNHDCPEERPIIPLPK